MPYSKIDHQRVRNDFAQAANSYDAAAMVQHEICQRTLERVDMLKIDAKVILDIGTGTGKSIQGLAKRFSNSNIIATDIALAMLQQCKKTHFQQTADLAHEYLVCNAAEHLAIADESVDLIFSTSTLQWCADINQVFQECMRVLKPQGNLIFSSFGPDTLKELRQSWANIDQQDHVHEFIDMHHLGDALLANQFNDPVVDMELITVQYQSVRQLLQDLKDTGSRGKFSDSNAKGLTGKEKYQQLLTAYEQYRDSSGSLPASYEVIYGYAHKAKSASKNVRSEQEFTVPIEDISAAKPK